MPAAPATPTATPAARRLAAWFVPALLIAITLAYHATWRAPFVFDDHAAIVANPSIRSLWPLTVPLSPPPGGLPVSGRPVPNLTFALDHALGGIAPAGYHATNVALHGLTALVLFSLLRRTLHRPILPARTRAAADAIAATVAALWALHPLATAAVAYTSQRTEVLVSLFFLLTLDAFARATEREKLRVGPAFVAVGACALGMASKEVMAAAPLLVLLYDRTFVSGSFAAAWRAHGRVHAALMATWILLGWLALGTAGRGGTAGFSSGTTALDYMLTQAGAVTRYLGLVFWPHPLVFDHGVPVATDWRVIVPTGLLILALLALTVLSLRRWPIPAFAGVVFFALLAPSSSVVPVATQTIAEHRMYLPLAAVLVLLVAGLHLWLGRRVLALGAAVAVALGAATHLRTLAYTSEETLWRETAARRPDNARAHNNFATLLFARGDLAGGLIAVDRALELRPDYADAHRNRARALHLDGRVSEALRHAEQAQRLDPGSAAGQELLDAIRLDAADAALRAESLTVAIAAYRAVLQTRPDEARAHRGLGHALLLDGRPDEAMPHLDAAIARQGPTAALLTARGVALAELGRIAEARAALREALRIHPTHAPARQLLDELP